VFPKTIASCAGLAWHLKTGKSKRMVKAGDLIDNTIGVQFGLATLTAAAFGQICSDVSGVAFGGVIEAAATKLGLPVADLTPEQVGMVYT
jgi:hypothetical protein